MTALAWFCGACFGALGVAVCWLVWLHDSNSAWEDEAETWRNAHTSLLLEQIQRLRVERDALKPKAA